MLNIALIQMRSEKAAIEENLTSSAEHLDAAAARKIDIVAFPEMNLMGYADPTRYPQACVDLAGPEVTRMLALTAPHPQTVLFGIIESNPAGKPFITQIVARAGHMLGYYRKITIKDEECAWFAPGTEVPVFKHDGLTFGIAICADIDNEQVFATCAQKGAQVVFELAAPGLYGAQAKRNWQSGFDWWKDKCRDDLAPYAQRYGIWIPVATQAGRTCDEDFPGGGYLFDPHGQRRYATPDWQPGASYLSIDLEHEAVLQL